MSTDTLEVVDYTTLVIPNITDPATLACISRSRSFPQYRLMVEQALSKKCPFCQFDRTVNVLVDENTYWRAWKSPVPEENTLHHFIFAPKFHHTSMRELDSAGKLAWHSLMEAVQDRPEHRYQSSGILIRDGDATLSAGTIRHLHTHVMVPNGKGRVETPFYKGIKAERESLARAIVFEKLRLGTREEQLSDEEWKLVENRFG